MAKDGEEIGSRRYRRNPRNVGGRKFNEGSNQGGRFGRYWTKEE